MIIKGKRETYKVFAKEWGWSYAVPCIQGKRKFLGIIPYWKTLRNDLVNDKLQVHLQNISPTKMQNWFEKSVKEYEEHLTLWEEYK